MVSAACARAMARRGARGHGASYAVSTTGVAGPDPSEGHPVGTVFVAVDGPGGTTVLPLLLAGDRAAVQEQTCDAALDALPDRLAADLPEEETATR